MSEAFIIFISVIIGGVGIKLVEEVFIRARQRSTAKEDVREELRGEVLDLQKSIAEISQRVERWRRQYFDLLLAFNELSLEAVRHGLSEETVQRIRQRVSQDT